MGSGFGRAVGAHYPAQQGHHDTNVRILMTSGTYYQEGHRGPCGPTVFCFLTLEEVPKVITAVNWMPPCHTLLCVCHSVSWIQMCPPLTCVRES